MRLNVDEFYKLMEKKKIIEKTQLSKMLNVTYPTVFNALNGEKISEIFLEGFVASFPNESIKKYFIFEGEKQESE